MRYLLLILCFLYSSNIFAHKSSDSYLSIDIEQQVLSLKWDIALRDLQNVMNLDLDNNGSIDWGELKQNKSSIFAYSLARLTLTSNKSECKINADNLMINKRSDGYYAVLYGKGECDKNIEHLAIKYQLFFNVDTQHRGLVKLTSQETDISFSFSPDLKQKTFTLTENYTKETFLHFVSEGIWHIWIGFDHILFLMSLLLPAVLLRYQKHWIGVDNFPLALLEITKIVTAFTVAHSLTLSFVMMGKISLPVMLVESIIAISVVIAALNNLFPIISRKRWLLGFIFGLIHGFGFANVLSELSLSGDSLFTTLLGFNIGVELGQLAIVFVFMPLAYLIRNAWLYQHVLFKFGSASIAGMGCIWVFERAL